MIAHPGRPGGSGASGFTGPRATRTVARFGATGVA